VVEDLVAGHAEQPAAERAALRIVVELPDGPGDGAEDFLRHVGGVGVL